MKQYITIEQLNELPDESLRKLARWFDYEEFDETSLGCWRRDDNLRLSIGQMIEFLIKDHDKQKHMNIYDNTPYFTISNRVSHKEPGHMWTTNGWDMKYHHPNPWQGIDMEETGEELCDMLWRAVKFVLDPDRESRTGDRIRKELG